jgi:hypothetical protein
VAAFLRLSQFERTTATEGFATLDLVDAERC